MNVAQIICSAISGIITQGGIVYQLRCIKDLTIAFNLNLDLANKLNRLVGIVLAEFTPDREVAGTFIECSELGLFLRDLRVGPAIKHDEESGGGLRGLDDILPFPGFENDGNNRPRKRYQLPLHQGR